MKTEKEQVQEFLDIALGEVKKFTDSIDTKALAAAKELILEAEKNHNRVTRDRYRQTGPCRRICGVPAFFDRDTDV